MKLEKNIINFQSCDAEYSESKVVIFSAPMDTTTSFRPGTRFAGNSIRIDSFGIEWYSPYQDLDLKEFKTHDLGDLDLSIGDIEYNLNKILDTAKQISDDDKKIMMIGGEHLVTYPVVKALHQKHPNLHLIHFDAHTDLRDQFFKMKFSHATVIKRVHDLLGDGKIFQFGIRSGDKEEFEWAKIHTHLRKFDLYGLEDVVEQIKDFPVYITIDLDVLDPSVFPGTGTPEPGGITYKELLSAIDIFKRLKNIVGCDIVELAPNYDHSGSSTMVAVKTLRELILLLHQS